MLKRPYSNVYNNQMKAMIRTWHVQTSWTKLSTQKLQLEDLQAYITLRGSLLTSDDKKRVILESDSSLEGKLTINRVGASHQTSRHFVFPGDDWSEQTKREDKSV